jgi:hypothetical protein
VYRSPVHSTQTPAGPGFLHFLSTVLAAQSASLPQGPLQTLSLATVGSLILQVGVGAVQPSLGKQCTQAFGSSAASQIGVVPEHPGSGEPVSGMHGTQVFVDVSHAGLEGLVQSPLIVHATHVLVVVLHAGVAPVQAVRFVAVHWTHLF